MQRFGQTTIHESPKRAKTVNSVAVFHDAALFLFQAAYVQTIVRLLFHVRF